MAGCTEIESEPKLHAESQLAIPAAAFDDLLRYPFCRGMASHLSMHDLAVGMTDRKEDIEGLEPDRLHAEEITGPDVAGMPLEKSRQLGDGLPVDRRRMYFATVRADTLNPSLASSAWIRR